MDVKIRFSRLGLAALSFLFGCGGESGGYLSGKWLHEKMQSGDVWCYNHSPADQTCTLVERVAQIGKNYALVQQIALDDSGALKMTAQRKLVFTGDSVCYTISEDFYDSLGFFVAADKWAKQTYKDAMVPEERRIAFVEMLKKQDKQTLGTTTCLRFKVVDGAHKVEVNSFIDGIRQVREQDSVISFFGISEKGIKLRPKDNR